MGNSAGASQQIIAAPKGGGAQKGIGEKFSPDLFTGTGNFTVPIALPPGRNGFQPQINLVYSTGHGNGPFGLGWNLSVPGVSRKTWKGIPQYEDARDVFILSGAEDLVPVERSGAVTRYQPRTEGLFAWIERHDNPYGGYWQVKSKDGLISIYGTPPPQETGNPPPQETGHPWRDPATVADPDDPTKIFAWHLTQTTNPFGNRIVYEYERDQGRDGPHEWDKVYLKTIRYADYGAPDNPPFLISVTFEYEDRPDPFSDYRAGFEIRTRRRCQQILIHTHADQTRLVRSYQLDYLDEQIAANELRPERAPLNGVSLLGRVRVIGHDDGQPVEQDRLQQLPPLTFDYSRFQPDIRRFSAIQGADLPATSLANRNLELVDLFGRGLPDILEMNGAVRYWRNLGNGRFDLPRPMRDAPAGVALADAGVQLVDADGDGRTDLLVTTPQFSGYYPLRFGAEWDPNIRRYPQAPSFNLEDPEVKLFDLNGDGVTDAIRSGTRLECFFSDPSRGWQETRWVERRGLEEFPNVNFSDPRVRFADMSGDQLQDIVLIHDGSVDYWPNLGHGDWGRRVRMANSPRFPYGYNPARILIGDVDGDGLADIVYVDNGQVTLWINQSGNRWSEPLVIRGTPSVSDMDAVRLIDLLGNGVGGVLWSQDSTGLGRPHLFFLDFTGGVKPYLLNGMDNHMGATTQVRYATSTRFYLEDERRPETRWRTALPFPTQVVAQVEVVDALSRGRLVTEYRYHHGYWDGAEREFRGFGLVEQLDSESFATYQGGAEFDRQYFSAPTRTRTWFHLGPVGEGRTDWEEMDWSSAYWPGDPPQLRHTEAVNAFLRTLPDRPARRDALRGLRGSILRTEFYADDGSDRQNRPYTVTEYAYDLREESPPGTSETERPRLFFPHPRAQRTTQWERGDDPMTQFSFTEDYDEYGQPRRQTQIACPRGWRSLDDRPVYSGRPELFQEPYLATRTLTTYGEPSDPDVYIRDRVVRTTSLELTGTGGKRVRELAELGDTDPTLRVFAQVLNHYDGDAFEGLPFGQIGPHGALMRTESLVLTEAILGAAYDESRPPYFSGGSSIPWTAEYPKLFQPTVRPLAGYTPHNAEPHAPGLFVITERRQYDFQAPNPTSRRGLVVVTRDAFDRDTTISYDDYALLPVEVRDPVALSTHADYDYRVLQPSRVTDANGNPTEFSFTPLGLLKATWVRGKAGEGDRLDPSVVMDYDFLAFDRSPDAARQPIFVRTTRRMHHDTEIDVEDRAERDDTLATVEYSDGFGRLLQTRTQGEEVRFGDGTLGHGVLPADQTDQQGTRAPVAGAENTNRDTPNVVVSGWQIYDNKGRVVEKYEPFFSEGWDYGLPSEQQRREKATMFYDPRGQVVRTVNPDLSEQRVIYGVPTHLDDPPLSPLETAKYRPTPWEAYTYDANDNAGRTHATAGAAAYRHHWNTPSHIVIDGLGRTVLAVQRNRDQPAHRGDPLPPVIEYRTRSGYDIRGNLLALVDPLDRVAFTYVYDLANRPLQSDSIDAGIRHSVLDAVGNIIEQRDSKGALILRAYDLLNRPQHVWARNGDAGDVTLREILEYGDGGSADQDPDERARQARQNRLGRLQRHYDEAGLLTFDGYDFKGNVIEKARQVIADEPIRVAMDAVRSGPVPAFQVDWQLGVLLDDVRYQTSVTYDALNRIKTMRYPENVEGRRQSLQPHYNRAGALAGVTLDGETYVGHIAYNAKGQRTLIAYGNGVMTRYAYDPQTFRLIRLRTERFTLTGSYTYHPSGGLLQDFAYDYDLVGNILQITERVPGCGVRNNPDTLRYQASDPALASALVVGDALVREFQYDPLYRLTRATGRESINIANPRPWQDLAREGFNSGHHGTPNQDNAPNLTRVYWETYRYDPAGNMLELSHSNGWTRRFGMAGFTPRTWNDKVVDFLQNHDLQDWGVGGNRLTHFGNDENQSETHLYDVNGNLEQEFANRYFAWDHADRLVGFADRAGGDSTKEACYLYDAGGMRVKKLVRKASQVETTIYIDDIFEHHRQSGMANNTLHVMDNQSRVATVRAGDAFPDDRSPEIPVKYHLGDHLGSSNIVIGGAAASGDTFINREEYFPYGETSFGSFTRKRYRFTGKERDEESRLYYHGARYYASWLITWISADPFPVSANSRYSYVRSNPLGRTDPRGDLDDEAKNTLNALQETFKSIEENVSGAAVSAQEEGMRQHLVLEAVTEREIASRGGNPQRLASEVLVDEKGYIRAVGVPPGKMGSKGKDWQSLDAILTKEGVLNALVPALDEKGNPIVEVDQWGKETPKLTSSLVGRRASDVVELGIDAKTRNARMVDVKKTESLIGAAYVKLTKSGNLLAGAERGIARFGKRMAIALFASISHFTGKLPKPIKSFAAKSVPALGAGWTLFGPGDASAAERIVRAAAGEVGVGPLDLETLFDLSMAAGQARVAIENERMGRLQAQGASLPTIMMSAMSGPKF